MIRLDTLRIKCDIEENDVLEIPKGSIEKYFDVKEERYNGAKKKSIYRLKKTFFGLSEITIQNGNITVTVSGKLLFNDYLKGISINTIENLVENINSYKIVRLDKNLFIENAIILKADVTENIIPNKLKDCIRDYQIYSTQKKYKVEPYNTTGIVITSKHKTISDRLTIYDKEADVSRNIKSNRQLWEYIKPNDAKGIFRIEANLKHFKDLRNAFQIDKNNNIELVEVLKSNMNPIYDILNRMYDFENPTIPIKEKGNMNLIEYRKYLDKSGLPYKEIVARADARMLLETYNSNLEIIKDILKNSSSESTANRHFKEVQAEKKRKDYSNLPNGMNNLIEIRDLIKAT